MCVIRIKKKIKPKKGYKFVVENKKNKQTI
jgi:hypothetical protein